MYIYINVCIYVCMNVNRYVLFVCLFVLDPQAHLSHGVNSQGRTYGDLPYHPGHSSPPRLIFLHVPCPPPPPPPPPPILLSCILHQVCTLPRLPVLYIYSNHVSGLSLPCLPVVNIYFNPTKMNPSTLQTPHINCVSLLFPKQFHHQHNSKIAPLLHPPCLPAPAPLTYNGGSLPLSFSMNQQQLC